MNRRKFFARIAAAAAVPVILPAVNSLAAAGTPAAATLTFPPPPSPAVTAFADANGKWTVREEPREESYQDYKARRDREGGVDRLPTRLELHQARGLIKPCPNCQAEGRWHREGFDTVKCGRCGWLDRTDRFLIDCSCADCTRDYLLRDAPQYREELSTLERDAPAGRLYIVTVDGRPVTQTTLNRYDVTTDSFMHHVVERQVARVCCAIKVEKRGGDAFYRPVGATSTRQPNGNLLIVAWEILDCDEWRESGDPRRRG